MKGSIKKEFEVVAAKIHRLEELRQELNALDTHGFESDESSIRAKLKDVKSVGWIEERIKLLRRKISEREKNKDSGALVLRRKISEMQKQLERGKNLSAKKQLSKEELSFVRGIPNLQKKINELKQEFQKHTGAPHVHVDPEVDVLVDNKFDDFVRGIKAELTDRMKKKNVEMDLRLKKDLEDKQHIFADKYKKLTEEFHQRYKDKVKHELSSYVQAHFKEMLDRKLREERNKMVESLLRDNMKRLDMERRSLRQKAEKEYASHLSLMEKKKKVLDEKERRLDEELSGVKAEYAKMHSKLNAEKKMSSLSVELQKKALHDKSVELDKRKHVLLGEKKKMHELVSVARKNYWATLQHKEKEMKEHEESLKRQYESRYRSVVSSAKAERESLKKRLAQRYHNSREAIIKRELVARESELKKELEKEYRRRMQETLDKMQERVEKRKAELERHILTEAKRLLH